MTVDKARPLKMGGLFLIKALFYRRRGILRAERKENEWKDVIG